MKSHFHSPRGNSLAVPCNVSRFVDVRVRSTVVVSNVVHTIDSEWPLTFHTIEGEVPSLTAIQTTAEPEISDEFDFQGCVRSVLGEDTLLMNTTNRNSQRRSELNEKRHPLHSLETKNVFKLKNVTVCEAGSTLKVCDITK